MPWREAMRLRACLGEKPLGRKLGEVIADDAPLEPAPRHSYPHDEHQDVGGLGARARVRVRATAMAKIRLVLLMKSL